MTVAVCVISSCYQRERCEDFPGHLLAVGPEYPVTGEGGDKGAATQTKPSTVYSLCILNFMLLWVKSLMSKIIL